MFKPQLRKVERQLIRKIAKAQIKSLTRILQNNVEGEDVVLMCIIDQIDPSSLTDSVNKEIKVFQEVIERPVKFFELTGDSQSLSIHYLLNFFEHEKYEDARRSIFRKVEWSQPLPRLLFSLN